MLLVSALFSRTDAAAAAAAAADDDDDDTVLLPVCSDLCKHHTSCLTVFHCQHSRFSNYIAEYIDFLSFAAFKRTRQDVDFTAFLKCPI